MGAECAVRIICLLVTANPSIGQEAVTGRVEHAEG
jgi:hypothetical protein